MWPVCSNDFKIWHFQVPEISCVNYANMEIPKYWNFHRMTPEHDIYTKHTFLIRYVMKTISWPPAQPHASPDHPEYHDEISHYNALPDILHYISVISYSNALLCLPWVLCHCQLYALQCSRYGPIGHKIFMGIHSMYTMLMRKKIKWLERVWGHKHHSSQVILRTRATL